MNFELVGNRRLEINLTKEHALKLIENLTKSLEQCSKTGGAWFAEDATFMQGNEEVSGRVSIRTE